MSNCPVCHARFSWRQKWRFTRGLCSRVAAPCPQCQAMLIPAEWPWKMNCKGSTYIVLGIVAHHVQDFTGYHWFYWIPLGFQFYGIYLIIKSIRRHHYEVVTEVK